ncbi:hypothetical protein [Streptomyces sp. NPDC020607]|uniref:hypothetical protein n=1 Tax=Streptomyces sp. NPDC020607 TaxID=3365082 RepID=UPI003794C930
MPEFIQQLPALLGVIIGALGSYVAITRGDRIRFRREQAARWEERRLAVYTEYARVLKLTVSLTYRVAAHLGNDPHPHPLSPEEAVPHFTHASEARDPAGEALLMLGSPEVVDAARDWVLLVIRMEGFLREDTHDPEAWASLLDRQRTARGAYYAAVRRDLELPPGHPGDWSVTAPPAGPRTR